MKWLLIIGLFVIYEAIGFWMSPILTRSYSPNRRTPNDPDLLSTVVCAQIIIPLTLLVWVVVLFGHFTKCCRR